jgi:hypothetical protein
VTIVIFFWEKTFKPRAQVFSFGFYQKSFSSASFAARRELFSFFRFLTKHLKHLLNKKQPTTTGASFTGGAKQKTKNKTRDGGYLGSHIDEERSKMRYVVWIAEHVNHRIFERKWRSRVILRACLFECPQKPLALDFLACPWRSDESVVAAIGRVFLFAKKENRPE